MRSMSNGTTRPSRLRIVSGGGNLVKPGKRSVTDDTRPFGAESMSVIR